MCLLIVQPASAPSLTQAWLEDFYVSNSDGVGVMRVVDGELRIEKLLPKTAQDFVDFYLEQIEGHDCAFHLRMKTHGNIDMENCHPYEVFNKAEHGIDMWLMHNGVLSTGNAADVTKSDTWHYIRNYLRPMLHNNYDFTFTAAFEELIGEHIGASNKFVIMDNLGRTQTVNQGSGVYWGGRWLSNTYAWSSPLNTPKDYVDDVGLALQQIETAPAVKSWSSGTGGSKAYKTYSPSYMSGSYSDHDDWEDYNNWEYNHTTKKYEQIEYDRATYVPPVGNIFDDEGDEDDLRSEEFGVLLSQVDEVMEEMLFEIETVFEVKYISRVAGYEFVEEFGIDNFMEIAYMALDEAIDIGWFTRVLTDFVTAREAFPWLERTKPQLVAIN